MTQKTLAITSDSPLAGAYFIFRRHSEASMKPLQGNVVATFDTANSLKSHIASIIDNAKYYLKICSFLVQDEETMQSLIKKLESKAVCIFILTALDETQLHSDLLNEDDSFHETDRHFENMDRLIKHGAHLKAASGAHAKFIIRDGEEAMIMSSNLTFNSLNRNPESGVCLSDPTEVANLERIFDMLYRYGTHFHRFIRMGDNKIYIEQKEPTISIDMFPAIDTTQLRWTCGRHMPYLFAEIKNIVRSAKGDIVLSSYCMAAIDKIEELQDLIRHHILHEGYAVKIITRGMNHRQEHLRSCLLLKNLGCDIYADVFNHSKAIVAGDEAGMLFSANLDGNHGLTSGFEMGIYFQKPSPELNDLSGMLQWQIENAPYEFAVNPLRRQLNAFYDYHFTIFNKPKSTLPDQWEVTVDKHLSQKVWHEINAHKDKPLYCHYNPPLLYLKIDNTYRMKQVTDQRFELLSVHPANHMKHFDYLKFDRLTFHFL